MSWIRRALLELWAIFLLAGVIGFMGPFGTYVGTSLSERVGDWWALLMGAYILVRPAILLLRWIASATSLPPSWLVPWGVVLASAPLAMLWRSIGQDEFRALDDYTGLLPFSFLCALAVLLVAWWAERTDRQLGPLDEAVAPHPSTPGTGSSTDGGRAKAASRDPALLARLSPAFRGPIIALQSEDHYVRVHGPSSSELLLMRLRDAIAEMGEEPGEQVHRSWWVPRSAIAGFDRSGRSWSIRLANGAQAPVARESVERLQSSGFLPHPTEQT